MGAARIDPADATFQALVADAAEPMFVWAQRGEIARIYYANAALATLLGFDDADELVGRELTRGDTLSKRDGELVRVALSSRPVELYGSPACLATVRDAASNRNLQDELRQSQKMEAVGQLAGGIAHDFNNVLAVILSNVSFAIEDLGVDHPVTRDLREIESAAQRATKLTKQLLAFSRKQHHAPKPIAVDSVVTGLGDMLHTTLGETIRLELDLAPNLGTIEADRGHLEQVLMNLAINARDAMPYRGTLAVATRNIEHAEHGPCVMLEVTDTGHGMSDATKARIFEPFFTTKEVGKGTGLGLAMVFGIVKQNKGWIEVESEIGRGTAFRLYFPRTDRAAIRSVSMVPLMRPTPETTRATILIVEDDDLLRNAIRRQIAAWGFKLLEAANGDAALAQLRDAKHIDLLLTDLVMPGMDGRALAACVLCERPHLAVLFMSGYTEHRAVKTKAFPGHHFIEKPFSREALYDAIQRALAEPEVIVGSEPQRIAR